MKIPHQPSTTRARALAIEEGAFGVVLRVVHHFFPSFSVSYHESSEWCPPSLEVHDDTLLEALQEDTERGHLAAPRSRAHEANTHTHTCIVHCIDTYFFKSMHIICVQHMRICTF